MSHSMRACDMYRENLRRLGPIERPGPQFLRSLSMCSGLSQEIIHRLQLSSAVWSARNDTLLLREGDAADVLFILLDGLVRVEAKSGGRQATIFVLRPGDSFFVAPVLGGSALPVSARALNDVRVLTICAKEVRRLAASDPTFARFLLDELTRICGKVMYELKSVRTRTAFERLVAWTLAMHDQSTAGAAPEMPYEKSVLAARLGMAPETLSRNLARIAKLGVTIRGRNLNIKNPENLRRLVENTAEPTVAPLP